MKKNKKIVFWLVNIIFLSAIVFFAIELAGKGAELASLEDKLEKAYEKEKYLNESIYTLNDASNTQKVALDLGFTKPANIVYLDSKDAFARLLVR